MVVAVATVRNWVDVELVKNLADNSEEELGHGSETSRVDQAL